MKTRTEAIVLATAASEFEKYHGRYPTNLNELTLNPSGLIFAEFPQSKPTGTNDGKFLDAWHRRFVYTAPLNASTGYVGSFGRDGTPGGDGDNADHFVPLPAAK